ncbi:hypothetical protein ACFLZ8_05670 [Planctomycetota bacterium]
MQPYTKALAWAFWRERCSNCILFITILCAFGIFIKEFNSLSMQRISPVVAIIIETFGLAGFVISGIKSPLTRLKIPDTLYVKPVSSRFLAAVYLGLTILSVILMHLIAVLLYRLVGLFDLPVFVPLLALITVTLCVHAIYWSLSDAPVVCCVTTMIVCGFLFLWCKEGLFTRQISWPDFLRYDLPFLLFINICALVISFSAVKHARFGEKLRSVRFWERLYVKLATLLPGWKWKLKTPQRAYFWLLCRTSGLVMPLINLLFVSIALILLVVFPKPEKIQEIQDTIIGFAWANLFLLPFIGALMAHQGDKLPGISFYIAARPISNRSILFTIFKAFMANYLAGWIIYFIGFFIAGIYLAKTNNFNLISETLNEITKSKFFVFPIILIYLLGFWAVIGLTGSLFISGRKWLIFLFCAALFITPLTITFTNLFVDQMLISIILSSLIWLFAVGSIGGILLGFIHMVRRDMISFLQAGFLIAGYCICVFIFLRLNLVSIESPTEIAFICGLLVLPFAPLVTAPLALAWNRHR